FGPFSGFCPLFVHSLSTLPIRFLFLIQIPDSSPQHHPAGSAFKQAPVYRFPNPHIPSKNHFSQHRIFSSWSVRFWSFFGLCPLFVHSLSTLPIRFLFLIQIPDSSPQHHPAGSAFKQAPVYRFPNPHIPSKNHFSQHRIFSSWSVRFWSFFGLCPLFLHSFST